MSAIIAGKECKDCKKDYYLSFGHPSWFKKSPLKRVPGILTEDEQHRKDVFNKVRKSGRCPKCQLIMSLKIVGYLSEILDVDLDKIIEE